MAYHSPRTDGSPFKSNHGAFVFVRAILMELSPPSIGGMRSSMILPES